MTNGAAALEVADLDVTSDGRHLVRGAGLSLQPGGVLVILGESGSGKSLLAHAIMGTLPPELDWRGRIAVGGSDFGALDPERRRARWGRAIALLPQEPWTSLDPLMRVESQIAEVHALVGGAGWTQARARSHAALETFGLTDSADRFPFQLSGGMAQRVAVAVTLAGGARLLIADEPTKGLDAVRRDDVADMLAAQARSGAAVVVITHDIGFARRLGGDVAIMLESEIVETGPSAEVLSAPSHDYTKRLLAADPAGWTAHHPSPSAEVVVEVRDLAVGRGGRRLFEGLDMTVAPGEIVAASGPSGCGKTTLGNAILGLLPPQEGRIRRAGGVAAHRFQKLYQDPVAAFAPRSTLGAALEDVCRLHGLAPGAAAPLLARLRIRPDLLLRHADQVSGGELQRIALARALIVDPVFVFADEPTSRLDPVIQSEVMGLLRELVDERRMAVLMVTHDDALAAGMTRKRISLVGLGPAGAQAKKS